MNNYEMPYSFIFTDEELCDLWSYYRRIAQIIHCVEERHSLVITDNEDFIKVESATLGKPYTLRLCKIDKTNSIQTL